MENATNISKKKKTKKVLCYIALVILVILLFTPLVFKLAFKESKPKEEKKEDIISSLSCEKGIESISASFINDEPQNIAYRIKGNYGSKTEEEKEESDVLQEDRPVLRKFLSYSGINYEEDTDTSVISFSIESVKGTIDYELIFSNIGLQEEYFKTQGFNCSKITLGH